MVKVFQYRWDKEQYYPPETGHGPRMGYIWAYFPVAGGGPHVTEGVVTYIDWDAGVVMTNADELLIKG